MRRDRRRHDLAVVQRVGAPQHQKLGVFGDHGPHRLLLVNLERADNVRHDDLCGAGRVVPRGVHEAAFEVHHPAHQSLAVVQLAGLFQPDELVKVAAGP